MVKFSKLCSKSFNQLTTDVVVLKFRKIYRMGNQQNCALVT